jgi:hypothetical protein
MRRRTRASATQLKPERRRSSTALARARRRCARSCLATLARQRCSTGRAAPTAAPAWDGEDLRQQLQALLAEGLSRSEAARALAARSGQSRRELYALLHQPDEGAPDEVGPDEAP